MGNAPSQEDDENQTFIESQISSDQTMRYMEPNDRKEKRYNRVRKGLSASDQNKIVDKTIQKYDYLIIFPHEDLYEIVLGESRVTKEVDGMRREGTIISYNDKENTYLVHFDGAKKPKRHIQKEEIVKMMQEGQQSKTGDNPFAGQDRIKWSEASEIWKQAVPGSDDDKDRAVNKLAMEWMARFRATYPQDNHTIPRMDFLNLAREVIVNDLSQNSGLQLKVEISRDAKKVFCRIRAPIAQLERQADKMDHRLQFKKEIDPGYEFWRGREQQESVEVSAEIAEEARELDKDEANDTLEKLYTAGHIDASDLAVFDQETPRQWSTRVHALERIADSDQILITNKFPAYTGFDAAPAQRHLFNVYETSRGKTLFQSKDRLILTKAIIDARFDVGVLVVHNVLMGVMALHDANSGDPITKQHLIKRWTDLGSPGMMGAPCMSDEAMDHSKTVQWYKIPFSQPLADIRDYFGEKLAFFFAWLGFYTYWLIIPSTVGTAYGIYMTINGDTSRDEGVDLYQVAMVIILILWTVCYKEFWDREGVIIAVKWGTHGFEDEESDRPQFQGYPPENPRQRSPVTNHLETYYPAERRVRKQIAGLMLIIMLIAFSSGIVFSLFYLEYILEEQGFDWGSWVVGVILTLKIEFFNTYYEGIAKFLNNAENYQKETEYQDNLVFKTFFFQIFNNYDSLTFAAFFKRLVFGCTSGYCLAEVRELMIIIFFGRFIRLFYQILDISFWSARQDVKEEEMKRNVSADPTISDTRKPQLEEFEKETLLKKYEGEFDGYAKACLQYGYVAMFMVALPFAPLLALVENLFEIRLKAFALTRVYQRPDPAPAEDEGLWGSIINLMGLLCILTNVGLLVFTSNNFEEYSTEQKWLLFLVSEHVILAVVMLLHSAIPDMPDELDEVIQRQEFVVQKHKYGLGGDGFGSEEDLEKPGHIDITENAADKLEKSPAGGAPQKPAGDAKRIARLMEKLTLLERDIEIGKNKLKVAMKNETFNDETGIGQTKHGLSLGVLTVKLILAENISANASNTTVVISMKSTKVHGGVAPGPAAQVSKPAKKGGKGILEFNQVFTFAPVQTQDAEIVFDIMDKSAHPKRKGTARIVLRELANQQEQEKDLNIQRRNSEGQLVPVDKARLYVKAQFTYSKIVPLKANIFKLQDQKRQIENEITLRRLGQYSEV